MAPLDAIEEQYQLLHKLAEGGMGAVFKVRHRLLDEVRVVKVVSAVHATSDAARQRFEQEARAATQLRHPNIAQIFDFVASGEDGAYLVMEFIDGVTFKQLLRSDGPPPLALAVELARQSLEALGYLHDRGYLHRDVAPDNLMLSRGVDGAPLVKLIDLGLAKRPADRLDLTATNMFVGKVRYSSPEVFRRARTPATPHSDLYAFGVVFYELLTGDCPIRGSSFEELATAHLLEEPLSFEQTDPEGRVPRGLRRLVMSALAKDPASRPESARAFAAALEPYRSGAPLELPPSVPAATPSGRDESTIGLSAVPTLAAGEKPPPPRKRLPRPSPGRAADLERTQRATPKGPASAPRRRLAAVLGLILAVAVTGAFWLLGPPGGVGPGAVQPAARPDLAPAFGRLVVEAAPWARVTSVVDAGGRVVPIGESRETPAVLALPAGDYTIRLEHPDFPPSNPIAVTVPVAGTARVHERLGSVDLDDYFKGAGLYDELMAAGESEP